MKPILLPCLLLCFLISTSPPACAHEPTTLSGLTHAIDNALTDRTDYAAEHDGRVDSLRQCLASENQSEHVYRLYEEIINEFECFNTDSVLYYCDRAITYARERGDSVYRQRFALVKSSWYPGLGVVKEAIDDLGGEFAGGIFPANRQTAFESAARLYFSTASFYPTAELTEQYIVQGGRYIDSLRSVTSDVAQWHLLTAMLQEMNDSITMAKASYHEAIEHPSASPFVRSRAATLLAQRLESDGHDKEALYYFALAAYINSTAGDRTGWALEELGNRLYANGDLSRAYRYLNVALENAVSSGTSVRSMRIASNMPAVTRSYLEHDSRKINWLVVLTVCLFAALMLIVWGFTKLRRDVAQLRELKKQLHMSGQLKESAISNFLGLCIIYMERLEDFTRIARRKISAGQVDDLYNQLRTGKFMDDQSRVANRIFDSSFTKVFPTFVADVNALLQPDRQIVTPAPGELTTELRVLAFMRLGVRDTQKVARILGLSLNTVYTYRNKLRVLAINRETFEDDVMKIGQLE